jgi:hypothetical protein
LFGREQTPAVKRVRITVDPGETELPLTFERATSGSDGESSGTGQVGVDIDVDVDVKVVNWNVATPPAAFLLRVEGEYERFGELLAADPNVETHELLALTERACYCFVTGVGTPGARRLWEQFGGGSLMTVPPAEWNPDGSYTFTVVGTQADVQAAVETVPDGVDVTVEAVGGRGVAEESLLGRLSERQRAAVAAALDCGYYDVPRGATTEDVARALGCAPSTAAEHLQRAEATVLHGLFE